MGRLGRADPRDQGKDRHHRAARQQELRPVAGAAGCRARQPGGRRDLPGRDVRHPGQGRRRDAGYKPANWNDIPDGLKDPQGNWFAIHSGTLGFMVNVDALRGKPVPQSWADCSSPSTRA
jgi:hypothetical protein